ncbi:hypothetical protein S83_008092, partial [Arachis hypogaea]
SKQEGRAKPNIKKVPSLLFLSLSLSISHLLVELSSASALIFPSSLCGSLNRSLSLCLFLCGSSGSALLSGSKSLELCPLFFELGVLATELLNRVYFCALFIFRDFGMGFGSGSQPISADFC